MSSPMDQTTYGAIPLVKAEKSMSRVVKAAVAATALLGVVATAYIQPSLMNNLMFEDSNDPLAHCELDDACDTCGKTLFEETGGDLEAVCVDLDTKCNGDCSEGNLECVKDTLCSNTDDKSDDKGDDKG